MREHDGLWATGLRRRTRRLHEPACVDCHDDEVEPRAPSELTLLWRRTKAFRRHRIYR